MCIRDRLYVSATPAPYELEQSTQIVEQLIRPTGLLDPVIYVRPEENQMEDLLAAIRETTENGERSLVLTLTKQFAEVLADYFKEEGLRVEYLHSDIEMCIRDRKTQRPALIIAHNKTLAGQLTAEFMNLFPDNAVEY